jgi:hypothetical protein
MANPQKMWEDAAILVAQMSILTDQDTVMAIFP